MAYRITITQEAENQLRALSARERGIIEDAVLMRLRDQPTTETHAIKRLRPNPLAEYELRVRDLRVLYNVDEASAEVILLIVGRKVGTALIVGGEVFYGHQSDFSEPASGGAGGGAE